MGLTRYAEAEQRKVEDASGDPAAYFPALEQALGAYEAASLQVCCLASGSQCMAGKHSAQLNSHRGSGRGGGSADASVTAGL